jgi:hypothetical protein
VLQHLQHEETQYLATAVKMLELMFKTCQNMANCNIPLDIFHIPKLLDLFQMQADYAMWIDLQHGLPVSIPYCCHLFNANILLCLQPISDFLLLHYTFIMDLTTKATLVQFEHVLQVGIHINTPQHI